MRNQVYFERKSNVFSQIFHVKWKYFVRLQILTFPLDHLKEKGQGMKQNEVKFCRKLEKRDF